MEQEKTTRFENLLHHYNYTYKEDENKRNLIKGKIEKIISALPKEKPASGRNRLYNWEDNAYESLLKIEDFPSYRA